MNHRLQFIINKIKSYWRLFYYKLPILRNATGIALIIFSLFYIIRFDAHIDFEFSETVTNYYFIQERNLEDTLDSSAALELFDTAPIFIPTRWNYGSTVFPRKRVISDAEFVSFEPEIELEESINLNRIEIDSETKNNSILYEYIHFDPRLLALFSNGSMGDKKVFSNYRTLKVEILESYEDSEFQKESIANHTYEINDSSLLSNLSSMIVLLRTQTSLVSKPIIYQSSSSEVFDEQILEWLKQSENIALLPKGFLKLTFYPN